MESFTYETVVYRLFECELQKRLKIRDIKKFPKNKRKAPGYITWTKGRLCAWCGNSHPEFHHHGPRGLGQKAPDWYGMPLCVACHRYYHNTGTLPRLDVSSTKLFLRKSVAENYLFWLDSKGWENE